MRHVERREFPSTSAETTATRLDMGNLFMSRIMRERSRIVKHDVQHSPERRTVLEIVMCCVDNGRVRRLPTQNLPGNLVGSRPLAKGGYPYESRGTGGGILDLRCRQWHAQPFVFYTILDR